MVYLKPQSPLYEKTTDNYFYPITTSDQIIVKDDNKLDNYSMIKTKEIQSILLASKWTIYNGQYTQSIAIEDLNENYNVNIKVTYTDNLEKDLLISKSASCVSYSKQDNDVITFYCLNGKPSYDIPIEIEVKI